MPASRQSRRTGQRQRIQGPLALTVALVGGPSVVPGIGDAASALGFAVYAVVGPRAPR